MSVIEAPCVTETQAQPVTRADVLHRAADLLEEFGWCQGPLVGSPSDNDPFCSGTAIQRALSDLGVRHTPERDEGIVAANAALGVDSTIAWNDTPGRTKAEVVARLRAAAEAS